MDYAIDTLQIRMHNVSVEKPANEIEKKVKLDKLKQLKKSISHLVLLNSMINDKFLLDGVRECELILKDTGYFRIDILGTGTITRMHIYNKDLYRLKKIK